MKDYIAWINGNSIAGPSTLADVEAKARAYVAGPDWQRYQAMRAECGKPVEAKIRITRGPRQLFAKAFVIA